MPSFTVKNIPDELYDRLRDAAELHRRSINNEIIACLERSFGAAATPGETLSAARQLRESLGGPLITLDELQLAKSTGRP
jgi:plasmid stability protein